VALAQPLHEELGHHSERIRRGLGEPDAPALRVGLRRHLDPIAQERRGVRQGSDRRVGQNLEPLRRQPDERVVSPPPDVGVPGLRLLVGERLPSRRWVSLADATFWASVRGGSRSGTRRTISRPLPYGRNTRSPTHPAKYRKQTEGTEKSMAESIARMNARREGRQQARP
jgi:hypothetical protein